MKKRTDKTMVPGGYTYPTIIDGKKAGTSMQRSAGDQVQQEMATSEIASETSQEAAYTRVDQYTLEIIQQIFPAPNKGLEFTAGVLHFAKIAQNVLPGLEDMGEHVAVISIKTIRTLAKLINWGYDTTHKYVTTFCALGLFRKMKQGKERLLVFPLERYMLPINLQPLDTLIAKSRPKVQQFARQVKIRLAQLNPAALTQTNMTSTFEGQKVSAGNTVYQSIFGIIESEGIDPATSKHLSKRIISEVLSKFDASRLAIQAHDETYEQAATGTVDSQLSTFSTVETPYSRPQPKSTIYQSESTDYQTKYPRYEAESTQYQIESTSHRTKYQRYQTESTRYQIESTNRQAKYPRNQVESTPEAPQGRLSGREVSSRGRLMRREVAQASRVEKTLADQSTTSRVSQRSANEYTHMYQEKVSQPETQFYTREEAFAHIMATWGILPSYEYILRENLIDWEADGLPTEFIQRVYAEIDAVNTHYAQQGRVVASHSFFLSHIERRAIEKLASEYQLDFVDVYNLILFRTNRERYMIASPIIDLTPPPPPEHNYRPQLNSEYQGVDSRNQEYQDQRDPYSNEYQGVDSRNQEYQDQRDPYSNEYQDQGDPYSNEYQGVDSRNQEYQDQGDFRYNRYQDGVDSEDDEYQGEVDPEQNESTQQQPQVDSSRDESTPHTQAQTGAAELNPPESTQQIPLSELIERAALKDGLTRLRIPRALSKQNYTLNFQNVYVTYNIKKLFNKILDDVTLRDDSKMFFAEIFDTARAGAAKNWYNKLFTKCKDSESLLAAFIETIIDLHSRGNVTIQNPGALFNKKIAESQKSISDTMREHIKVYGELCYEDFVLEIARLASREAL